jgi:hypothetical protein
MSFAFDLFAEEAGDWHLEADRTLPPTPPLDATFASADVGPPEMPLQGGAVRLLFEDGLPTPYAERLTEGSTRSLLAFMYRPRNRDEMLAFERRIEPRYQNFYAELGIFYAGVFDVPAISGPYLGEILFFAGDRRAAQHLMDSTEPAADIANIEDECRALQYRDEPRYRFWLTR